MLTVGNDEAEVERRLSEGRLECPVCAAPLRGWGHGRVRVIRLAGGTGWRAPPRRAVCARCGATHLLLAARVLAPAGGFGPPGCPAPGGAGGPAGGPPPLPPAR